MHVADTNGRKPAEEGREKKRVHNLISLDLIVKGTPEIQRNVQAHCDTLESTKKKNSFLLLVSLLVFFQSSVTLCQLAVTLASTHSCPRPAELGSASQGGGGHNKHKTKLTQLHTVAHKSHIKTDSGTPSAQTHKHTYKERPRQLKLRLVLESNRVGRGKGRGGVGGGVLFPKP